MNCVRENFTQDGRDSAREARVLISTNHGNDFTAKGAEFITTLPCQSLAGVIEKVEAQPEVHHVLFNKKDKGTGPDLRNAIDSKKKTVIVCKCDSGNTKLAIITMDPVVIRDRFKKAALAY